MGETGRYWKWIGLAFLSCAACGGDDDNSSGGIVTGLPAEQKLSTLSDEDVKKACKSVNDGANVVVTPMTLKRAFCVPFGVEAAVAYSNGMVTVDINKCQELVDTCVASTDDETDDGQIEIEGTTDDCEQATAADLQGCEATVGEYETCVNMVLNEAQRRLAELTCQNAEKLSSDEYANQDIDPAQIPQCQSIMAKCPEASLGIPFED